MYNRLHHVIKIIQELNAQHCKGILQLPYQCICVCRINKRRVNINSHCFKFLLIFARMICYIAGE